MLVTALEVLEVELLQTVTVLDIATEAAPPLCVGAACLASPISASELDSPGVGAPSLSVIKSKNCEGDEEEQARVCHPQADGDEAARIRGEVDHGGGERDRELGASDKHACVL